MNVNFDSWPVKHTVIKNRSQEIRRTQATASVIVSIAAL